MELGEEDTARHSSLHNFPARLAAGLYLLDSGLAKLSADQQAIESIHKMAGSAYGFVNQMDARKFSRCFTTGEILLATALLFPLVPDSVVGVGLTTFSATLFGLYFRIPGMRREGSLRPSPKGTTLAKNIWLLGIGISLTLTPYRVARNT